MGNKETGYLKHKKERCGEKVISVMLSPSSTYRSPGEIFFNSCDEVPRGCDLIVLHWSNFFFNSPRIEKN